MLFRNRRPTLLTAYNGVLLSLLTFNGFLIWYRGQRIFVAWEFFVRLERLLLDGTKYVLTEKTLLRKNRSGVSVWIKDSLKWIWIVKLVNYIRNMHEYPPPPHYKMLLSNLLGNQPLLNLLPKFFSISAGTMGTKEMAFPLNHHLIQCRSIFSFVKVLLKKHLESNYNWWLDFTKKIRDLT